MYPWPLAPARSSWCRLFFFGVCRCACCFCFPHKDEGSELWMFLFVCSMVVRGWVLFWSLVEIWRSLILQTILNACNIFYNFTMAFKSSSHGSFWVQLQLIWVSILQPTPQWSWVYIQSSATPVVGARTHLHEALQKIFGHAKRIVTRENSYHLCCH